MKFLPAIDLWNPAINSAVRSGQLKLQPGQWVKCGGDKLSRFLGIAPKSKTIVAAHFDGRSVPAWKVKSLRAYALSIGAK